MLKAVCPDCGAALEIGVDLSEGPPNEVGTECDCGCIPIWSFDWWYEFVLGGYKGDERKLAEDRVAHYYAVRDGR